MDKYVDILKKHGIKVTPQRLEILRFLDTHHTHPSADEIYMELKKKHPSLSKTTIYNTIQSLKDCGLLVTLLISPNESRFDSLINPHHHLLCSECGKILDINVECPYSRKVLAGGHRIDEVHGYFKGVCEKCLMKGGK
ncbi:MAG: transcriptional repressor [Candidatus Thermoplasmatota archaeon]|nr:transcriptional repressor [Euryarchaeota archaeon]MBU4032403.1 transcriptional repressor [Candidatus Thermoplasmatota archaeon]MBU4071530.1 transcriptional repressor [Candidatus Thermoplasmatota archaeon]MBU4143677.1 transcriptional repressor [Candidatus Thermoplasmatota archaeon]MBU4591809.1 transcriptional repressor [Candidatus Thermoplasmatota archaeon]